MLITFLDYILIFSKQPFVEKAFFSIPISQMRWRLREVQWVSGFTWLGSGTATI